MTEDESSQNSLDQLIGRLDKLENALRAQTARLHQIEQYLSLAAYTPEAETDAHHSRAVHEPSATSATNEPATPNPVASSTPSPSSSTNVSPSSVDASSSSANASSSATNVSSSSNAGAAPSPSGTRETTNSRTQATTGARAHHDAGAHTRQQGTATAATRVAGVRVPEAKKLFDLEMFFGGNVAAWAGIIAACVGVAFFLKHAFEKGWIGPSGRVLLGAAAGVGVLALGERLRAKGLRQYAYVLSGGGILILYLSIYAAYGFYQLINQPFAFLLMMAVTATAVLLSARYDALPIAFLGLVGGFLTPVLLSTGRDNQAALFSYIALLDAGVLALAYLKRWRSLYYSSFAATLLMILGWATIHYTAEKFWLTFFFISLFFILFSLLAIVHNVLPRRHAQWLDITLIVSNATFYFTSGYALLDNVGYERMLGSFALVVSAFYILLYYAAWSRHRADRLLIYSLLGAAITFFTVAIAIQLEQQWVTIGWAAEAALLTWIGLRSETDAPRHASLVVFLAAVAHWFALDVHSFSPYTGSMPLFNPRAASCAALVGACAFIVWLYRHSGARVAEDERAMLTTALVLAGNLLAFVLLSLDVNDYFERQKELSGGRTTTGADGAWERLENSRQFALTVLWTFYATAALVVGVVRRLRPLRIAALGLLACVVIKLLAFDIRFYDASWHTPLVNQTFAAFLLVVVALAFAATFYARADDRRIDLDEREVVLPVMLVAANLLALVALSAETSGYFGRRIGSATAADAASPPGALRDLELAQQLSLSIIWMLYAGAMLAFGHLRRNRLLRVMALLLLGLTTLKVFFWDLSSLDRIYRIISFIVLGLILLAVSYVYQKSQQRERATEAEAESG